MFLSWLVKSVLGKRKRTEWEDQYWVASITDQYEMVNKTKADMQLQFLKCDPAHLGALALELAKRANVCGSWEMLKRLVRAIEGKLEVLGREYDQAQRAYLLQTMQEFYDYLQVFDREDSQGAALWVPILDSHATFRQRWQNGPDLIANDETDSEEGSDSDSDEEGVANDAPLGELLVAEPVTEDDPVTPVDPLTDEEQE